MSTHIFFVATPVLCFLVEKLLRKKNINGLCNSKHTNFCWNVFFIFELRINQLFSFFREKCCVSFCWQALDIDNLAGDCVVCSCQCQVPYVNVPENVW